MFQFPDNPNPGDDYNYGGIVYEYNGYAWARQGQAEGGDAEGVPDGDKGDIVVSGGGYIWNFDPAVVTAAGRALLDDASAVAQRTTLGLDNVNNTSDANKPVSAATQTALNLKYDKTGGTISGAVLATADLAVSNGRIINYGLGGSAERSTYYLNQNGSKALYNDGVALNLQGTPLKVTSTLQSSFAGPLNVGGVINAADTVNVSGVLDVAGQITGRSIQSVNGIMRSYGYQGVGNAGILYMSQSGLKYIHQDGTTFNFIGSQVAFQDTTEATASNAASVRVAGGLGVAKAIRANGLVAGSTVHSGGYSYFGSSGTHFAGPTDANIEIHAYATGHYWSYNRSTGNLVWTNSGGNVIIYDNGLIEAKGFVISGGGLITELLSALTDTVKALAARVEALETPV